MSAFLAVLLSVILLFQNTFYSLTGYAGAQAMLKRMLDQSAYSVLADFDGKIKNEYGLYILYQDGISVEDRLSSYLSENLKYESEFGLLDIRLQDMETEEQGFSYLSLLETQILDYCKYRVPAATVEEFLDRTEGLLSFLQSDSPDAELEELKSLGAYDPEKTYEKEAYEPYDMRQLAQEDLKKIIDDFSDSITVSNSVFRTLPSQRLAHGEEIGALETVLERFLSVNLEGEDAIESLNACVDDLSFEGMGTALWEDYLLNEYILQVFNSKTDSNREDSFLRWEVEYIIWGNQSDTANANYIKTFILLIRFLLNTVYLYQQQDMVMTAEIASYLATLIIAFEGQPLVQQGILLAWSFMESQHDYDLLVQGEQVPVYKTEDTWKYWVSYQKDGAEGTLSLFYKDYLRIFLLLVPRELRLARILDLIQLNESQKNTSFQILSSVTKFQVTIVCSYGDKKKWLLQTEGTYAY